ncbi:MAG: YitT family protein [Lentimicrobiaceae bacterium]|nr:YitT family protein [Lentimicrobiaceae bacterium]
MKTTKNSVWFETKKYFIVTICLFMMALGWTGFLIPNDLLGGGVSGISTLVYWSTGISTGITIFSVNALLLILAIKILGFGFGFKTIYSIIVSSLFFSLLQHYFTEPIITDKLLAGIIGGSMSGAAVGIIFNQGSSTGGTDIIALIINKYRDISPGRIILIIDVAIISCSWFITRDIESLFYSFVVMAVASYAIDLMITGDKQSVQLFIFSSKASLIADRIGKEAGRGVTFIKGTGWYTKTEHDILMVVTRKTESQNILRIVRSEDLSAFVTLNTVMGVYGKGFDVMRK